MPVHWKLFTPAHQHNMLSCTLSSLSSNWPHVPASSAYMPTAWCAQVHCGRRATAPGSFEPAGSTEHLPTTWASSTVCLSSLANTCACPSTCDVQHVRLWHLIAVCPLHASVTSTGRCGFRVTLMFRSGGVSQFREALRLDAMVVCKVEVERGLEGLSGFSRSCENCLQQGKGSMQAAAAAGSDAVS